MKQRKVIRALLAWYARCGRTLPWRNISSPYRILVSEVMLQQTQVGRVLEKYPQFMRSFPTLHRLAKSSQREVVVAWRGLGYNNRAIRLHQLAKEVVRKHHGKLPRSYEDLRALPGIGRYTANALLSSAFGEQVPVVDVNVRRVLSRIFTRVNSTSDLMPEEATWQLATTLLPKHRAYTWNQALMDLGASICTARHPLCNACPVFNRCSSRLSMKRPHRRVQIFEPSRKGIPNRIYRGKVIEALRGVASPIRSRSVPVDRLAQRIIIDISKRDGKWWNELLAGLVKDGLIVISANGSRVALK